MFLLSLELFSSFESEKKNNILQQYSDANWINNSKNIVQVDVYVFTLDVFQEVFTLCISPLLYG